ncbi:MAG: fibronectin type III domain-containing protein [Faecalibacterium sp.]|nr:fibronectin type III domain-containing protein [Ruminococcus sp.]MCM1391331.1 fibronectin type III domain-containing protein [Ruminococcus sp.]MCM1484890.1 fibronectin type III domain-containing protein [Faecalibacterium sp.]
MEKTKIFKRSILFLLSLMMIVTSFSVVISASAASAKKISECTITVSKTAAYTGKALKPTVTVKSGKTTLKKDKHYTVSYSNNKNLGTAKVTVKAKSGSGYTGSKTVNFSIVPGKAKSFKATSTTSSITLSWSKVAGATKYEVYSYTSSNKKYKKIATVTKPTVTVKKLSAGKTYSYAVKAIAVSGKKTYTGSYSSVFNCATAPGKVSSVKLSSVKDTSMTVSWKKVSGASGYQICSYNSSTKKYSVLATVSGTKATVKSLKGGTNYKIAVRAYRKVSGVSYYGAYSSQVSAQTLPGKVTGVKATPTVNSVTLTWTKLTGVTGYKVYEYNTSKKTYTLKATVSTNKATVSSLKAGTNYSYAVRGYRTVSKTKTEYGSYSAIVKATTLPEKVTGLKATPYDYSVKLTWNKATGASGYYVYSYDSSSKKSTKVATVTGTSTYIYNLALNKSYSYYVTAYNSAKSAGTKSDTITTKTKRIDNLKKYQDLFNSGTYKMDLKMQFDPSQKELIDIKYATKDGSFCVTMDMVQMAQAVDPGMKDEADELGNLEVKIYHDAKKNKSYMMMDFLAILYSELEEDDETVEMFIPKTMKELLIPKMASSSKITESSEKLNGKTHATVSYKTIGGSTCKYFFLNGELVRIDSINNSGTNTIYISGATGTVSDSDVSIPKDFPMPPKYWPLDKLGDLLS